MSITSRLSEIERARNDIEYLSRLGLMLAKHNDGINPKLVEIVTRRLLTLLESLIAKEIPRDPDGPGSNPCGEIFLEKD